MPTATQPTNDNVVNSESRLGTDRKPGVRTAPVASAAKTAMRKPSTKSIRSVIQANRLEPGVTGTDMSLMTDGFMGHLPSASRMGDVQQYPGNVDLLGFILRDGCAAIHR